MIVLVWNVLAGVRVAARCCYDQLNSPVTGRYPARCTIQRVTVVIMRPTIALALLLLALVTTQACRAGAPTPDALQTSVVTALDTLVAELVAGRPADVAAYTECLRSYLEAHPAFFGSAAALLDDTGTVIASPYVYRTADGYKTSDLALPSYNIEAQEWFTMPLAANAGIWTAPYFDAGGGEIWMITRSVPARDDEGIFAIVTTDLLLDAPPGDAAVAVHERTSLSIGGSFSRQILSQQSSDSPSRAFVPKLRRRSSG